MIEAAANQPATGLAVLLVDRLLVVSRRTYDLIADDVPDNDGRDRRTDDGMEERGGGGKGRTRKYKAYEVGNVTTSECGALLFAARPETYM